MEYRKILLPLLVVMAVVVAFSNSFNGCFIYDDYIWILENTNIRHFLSSMLYSSRPILGLTFYLNSFSPDDILRAADFHLVNLLIHVASALLLYGVMRRTLRLPALIQKFADTQDFLAASVAIIWAVHPLQTESVTYIVQRSESLMGMFYLLALYSVIRGLDPVQSHRWHTAAIASCALGMASKPVMVTAPLVILLYDSFFVAGSFADAFRERWKLYVGLAATWIIPAALLSVPNESSSSGGFGAAVTDGPVSYFLTQQGVILHYIKLSLWPSGLCIDYDWPPVDGFSWCVMMQAGAVVLTAVVVLLLSRRRNPFGFVGLWFFVNLLPTSSFLPLADYAAEHRMYLPLISVVIVLVFGVYTLFGRVSQGKLDGCQFTGRLFGILVALISLALVLVTLDRNRLYESEESMWRAVVSVNPENLRGHLGVGASLLKQGRLNEAEKCFKRILEYDTLPRDRIWKKRATVLLMAYINLGVIRFQEGKYKEAEALFRKSISITPCEASRRNLMMALEMQKRQ